MFFLPRKCFIILALGFGLGAMLAGQTINQAEFIDKPIKEIVMAIGALGGKTVVVDETVTGNGSYFIKDKTFDQAMQLVLESSHLYMQEKNGVNLVSRIMITRESSGAITVRAAAVDLETLIRRISRELQQTVFYDAFPSQTTDVSLTADSLKAILNALLKKLPNFNLESTDNIFYLRNAASANKGASPNLANQPQYITQKDGVYSVHGKNIKVSDLLANLFASSGKEYSLLKRSDSVIDRIDFDKKSFETLLRLILEQTEADYVVLNDIYYIIEINRADVLKKLESTFQTTLKYLSVNQLTNLIPNNLINGNAFKIDKNTNTIIFNGTAEEINPIIEFIKLVDKPNAELNYYRYDLMNITVENFLPALPESCKTPDPIIIKGQNSVILVLSPERDALVKSIIALVDKPKPPFAIKLQYIKAEDLLAKLPSFVAKDQVSMAMDQRYVFFSGSKDQYDGLLAFLKYIDIPVPQIKYQVLVVQYQDSLSSDLGFNFNRDSTKMAGPFQFLGDNKNVALLGDIGKVIGLNFDIIGDFGYMFAASLNAGIATNRASVLLDTTLQAMSNQEVNFKNTSTYRYFQNDINPDTGKPATTGVTKEIVSGISLTLKGWVAGDGMISMTISSNISKLGSGGSSGSLPQTFEKVISTSVRTQSGKPLVVGGIMQHDEGDSSNTLFLHNEYQNTELMIYIIPRVETPIFYDSVLGDSLMYLYNRYSPLGRHEN